MTSPETVATDSGPLISLARVGLLDLLKQLPYRFVTTATVKSELQIGVAMGFTRVPLRGRVQLFPNPPAGSFDNPDLGPGELSIIRLALKHRIRLVCVDDKLARQAVQHLGLKPFGTLGLLRKAKELRLVPLVRPIVEEMQRKRRWMSARFIEDVLKGLGE